MRPHYVGFTRTCYAGLLAILAVVSAEPAAHAENTAYFMRFDALSKDDRITGELATIQRDVALYYGNQPAPAVAQDIGTATVTRTTNGVFKSAEKSCSWAMAAALKVLHEDALKAGGNAVINIVSDYEGQATRDPSTYECHVGVLVSRISVKGTIVKLR